MKRITLLFVFLFFQTATLFSQVKMKKIDVLVDSFLVKNELSEIPNNMFLKAEVRDKNEAMIIIRISLAKWQIINDGLRHPELFKYYKYALTNNQSIIIEENLDRPFDKESFPSNERLEKADKKFLELVKSRSSSTTVRTDIAELVYAYFPKPEIFHWEQIIDYDEEEAAEVAEEAIE